MPSNRSNEPTVLVAESTHELIAATGVPTTGKRRPTSRPPIPESHADIALADMRDVCGLIRMGQSWVHAEVAAGRFPLPVIREVRCTRWRLADVRHWLAERTKAPPLSSAATVRAKTASDAAAARRRAKTTESQ